MKVPVSPVGLIDPDEGIVRGAKTEASAALGTPEKAYTFDRRLLVDGP